MKNEKKMKVEDVLDRVDGKFYFKHSRDRKTLLRNKGGEVLGYKFIESGGDVLWCAFIFRSETRKNKYYYFLDDRRYRRNAEEVFKAIRADVDTKNVDEEIEKDMLMRSL